MAVNKEAFEHLQRVLMNIEDQNLLFDLGGWATEVRLRKWWPWGGECKTAFCVIGWAAQDPWFVEKGLSLETDEAGTWVHYGELDSWEATAKFLGITVADAEFLFDSCHYGKTATPSEVAIRMRAFLRSKDNLFTSERKQAKMVV